MTEPQLLAYSPAPAAQPAPPRGESREAVDLPRPMLDNDVPLMAALATRMSSREFAATPLPPATLGTMLWAADGINRPASGGRTAPSAHAFNEIDVYVALPAGVYRYDAPAHRLVLKHAVDAQPDGLSGLRRPGAAGSRLCRANVCDTRHAAATT